MKDLYQSIRLFKRKLLVPKLESDKFSIKKILRKLYSQFQSGILEDFLSNITKEQSKC
jgi:hypothetical protein